MTPKPPIPQVITAPGHPVKAGAGYDCSCGECLALRSAGPEPVHDDARDIGAQRASELLAKAGDEEWLGI